SQLDRVIGREQDTERVIQILNRRQKNNPCLIGEPGVGKTAVAEGLAQKIAAGDVPYKLLDKEVYLLDLTSLVAGTQFRGQFESRMKGLIDEVKRLGNIILVIDEVHNLVGAGDAEGSMNAASILKPALSRGEIQVIGATTFAEYRKHIEKDTALERRFQPVTISEPSIETSVEIIKGIRKYYEQHHGVIITDEAARQAVLLSERYITDRFLPDKAIDLIDEACSDINLKNPSIAEAERLKKDIAEIRLEHDDLMNKIGDTGTYQRMAYLKSREMQQNDKLAKLMSAGPPKVTTEDLARVIELWTKIPASRVCEEEFSRLAGLETRLKARIIGQDEAIASVAAAIRRNRAGISAKRKPVSFIFVGPTGVGKTELVKQLAMDLFDAPESLIRLDMSEFMEKHSVSRLIGAPPGYVGYDEAGQLTEKIRRRPYSIVLFDEIEKAHPDVLNVLLQILDDGRVADAHGRHVSFENTVVIMTSNAGSDRQDGSVGFGRSISQQGREKALKALSDIMRPEFINRVDEIVSFNQLTEDNFERIADIMLKDLASALKERNIRLTYDEAVLKYLTKKSYSIKYGARNLRRLIQKEIEDKVASVIIESYSRPVMGFHLSLNGDSLAISSV
ncbi:MAG: ATP-dependent Clp protease ATP-binding subunit, partial [Bacillota bacterium]|nr:ATP-dependent Clp protease ATP-binding subunit [Bacillota bacterium]